MLVVMSTQAHSHISMFEDEVQVGGTTQTHGGQGQGGWLQPGASSPVFVTEWPDVGLGTGTQVRVPVKWGSSREAS